MPMQARITGHATAARVAYNEHNTHRNEAQRRSDRFFLIEASVGTE
jgi:hypothetical protein